MQPTTEIAEGNPGRRSSAGGQHWNLRPAKDIQRMVLRSAWIDAIVSGLISLARFALVLRRDIDAIRNAIDLPWSNGQAQAHINRLKTIKRATHGSAGSEFLRVRMMPIKNAEHHAN
ncbi:ISL3 family insertion sequence transposase domain-containing protein (plasmid) [Rhizobium sp. NXC24]|nr:ISL3 family insertion sequence transposase domain-containing protein [Rhizobium sp. NXC24]